MSRAADNDNRRDDSRQGRFVPLDSLPLFATDREIAVAVAGRARADYWQKAVLPALERSGFPAVDPLHLARPVPLVKRFYEAYFGITAGVAMAKPDGEERLGQYSSRRKRAA